MAIANKTNTNAFAAAMSGKFPEINDVSAGTEKSRLNPFAEALSKGSNGGGERTFASALGAGLGINPEEAQTEKGRKALEIAQIAERNRAKMASEASAQKVIFDQEKQTTTARIIELRQIFLQTASQNAQTKAQMKTTVGYAAVSTYQETSNGGGAGLTIYWEEMVEKAKIMNLSVGSADSWLAVMGRKKKRGAGAAMANSHGHQTTKAIHGVNHESQAIYGE